MSARLPGFVATVAATALRTSETDYAKLGMRNAFELYAIDEAGNRSAPAVSVIDL